MQDLHPTAGVRVLLELHEFDAAAARYRGAIYTSTARFDYRLTIALPDGAVTFVETPAEGSQAHTELVHAMARSVARDALASSPFVWPHRLFRWRDK